MTRILALDLGLRTGWAFLRTDRPERMESGVWHLDGDEAHERFTALAAHLASEIEHRFPDLLAYEDIHFAGGGADALISYGGLRGVALLAAARARVPYRGITPATVKRAAGLRSHAEKRLMLDAAMTRWPGWSFETHDEADARFVAVAAVEVREGS